MQAYGRYLLTRLGQFALVVFIGVNITYLVTHATPIDPVEQAIGAVTSFGATSPDAIEDMRQSLRILYGVGGDPVQQYLAYWGRVLRGDFGPSLSAFPTPVSTLIGRALPWTIGLLLFATVLSWLLGNLLGGLAGYFPRSRILQMIGVVAMGLHPIPYYIVAFVLLIIFGFIWPVLQERMQDNAQALQAGRCDAIGTDATQLAALRSQFPRPNDYVILEQRFSKEPYGPVVRRDDQEWFDVVRWVLFGLIEAEELGVTSQNAEQMRTTSQNPSIRRLLGTIPDLGQAVKLQPSWLYDAIRAIGNYGELHERNLGPNTPIGLPRGANDLWTRGGLMYAGPLR